MIIIIPAQCRAARALLNWSQPDLAERWDMHVQTISAFENESGQLCVKATPFCEATQNTVGYRKTIFRIQKFPQLMPTST